MRIALTRDPAQAGPLEAGLRAAGLQVQFLPLTEQRLPEDTSALKTALAQLSRGEFAWLLLASGNAVRALCRVGWDGTVPEGVRVGVVGPGTARVLADLTSVTDPWMPAGEKSAAGVLAEMPAAASGAEASLLLPQSRQARSELRRGLETGGWQVTQIGAYETASLVAGGRLEAGVHPLRLLPTPEPAHLLDLDRQAADLRRDRLTHFNPTVVLVTSSSAADALADLGVPERVRLLAIGRPTAKTLGRRGITQAHVLREPSAAAVLAALGR
ncbi:uroporphyrinogen-III synthase [Nesterenkonia lutea]|uniref:Uroporphyrinogen-III synthase n=1 Tax=Nesterenkonia lutea TaxID=272919 RepID=A0ABR9JF69_9MICC|nr:uroporphyrinogen-III synthase [Nesterenkonia lutea]MBE1524569.1 uroporphyrinogen-III synthase [Nesterenkonia lutea]